MRSSRLLPAVVLAAALALSTGVLPAQEITVLGNGVSIENGDFTPSETDHTHFGEVSTTSGVIERTFTIRNDDLVNALLLGTITRVGGNLADFSIIAGPPLNTVLTPGQSTAFIVRFNPSAPGNRSTTIRIFNSDFGENPFEFVIRGVGTVPVPEINVQGNGITIGAGDPLPSTADHTDFGTADIDGETVTRTFTVQNVGDASLTVSSISAIGGDFSVFTVEPFAGAIVPALFQFTFDVTYDPSATGLHATTIRIASDDANEDPYDFVIQGTGIVIAPEIAVSGNGIAIPSGAASPNAADHTSFGSLPLDGSTLTRAYTIANDGLVDLTIASVQFTGAAAADFSLTTPPAGTITPGNSMSFTVTWLPGAEEIRTATVRIESNDPATPDYQFAVEGAGGSFRLLNVTRDGADAVISFAVNPDPGPSSYIYSLQQSPSLETGSWTTIQSLLATPGGTEEFRVMNAFGPDPVFWRITEVALP